MAARDSWNSFSRMGIVTPIHSHLVPSRYHLKKFQVSIVRGSCSPLHARKMSLDRTGQSTLKMSRHHRACTLWSSPCTPLPTLVSCPSRRGSLAQYPSLITLWSLPQLRSTCLIPGRDSNSRRECSHKLIKPVHKQEWLKITTLTQTFSRPWSRSPCWSCLGLVWRQLQVRMNGNRGRERSALSREMMVSRSDRNWASLRSDWTEF